MKKLSDIYGESYNKKQDDNSVDKLRALNERRDLPRQLKMVQVKLIEAQKENDRLRRRLRESEQKLRDAEQSKRILERTKSR
jgi:hypothetical protein